MKTYTLIKYHCGRRFSRETTISGTVPELTEYFDYTLEVGHSWNKKINPKPKTITALVKNINASYEEKQRDCFDRDYVRLEA